MWATQHIACEILITRDPNTDSFWILFALVIDSEHPGKKKRNNA